MSHFVELQILQNILPKVLENTLDSLFFHSSSGISYSIFGALEMMGPGLILTISGGVSFIFRFKLDNSEGL